MSTVTCIAPVNIAVIKYWGKRDETLILPANDSISASLDTDQLCAKTTVMASPNFKEDQIWLNGQKEDIRNPRLQNCLAEFRKRAGNVTQIGQWKVHICSENNFPTAAGLASSAAGYACLIASLANLYEIKGDISSIARVGSGSACRSVLGGFVKWSMGSLSDGTDSIAKQIAPPTHWPEMRVLILVVNDAKKKFPSSVGMKRTMETSDLLKHRIKHVVPERVNKMERAIMEKDFKTFAEHTMKDSNQMHAVCLDSYPPFTYMNEISHVLVDLVHLYNEAVNDTKVAYTFDAGPNATLYLLEENTPEFMGVLDYFFPPLEDTLVEYKKGLPIEAAKPSKSLLNKINAKQQSPGRFKYIIYTQIGDGPKVLEDSKNHLLNKEGLPIKQT
ncbi:PREDICTED: diphosphomevalonate decarboxylase [Habropoda laboriosa]|uniref:diphosphomevalonate decarboxylase n=1 Tax=Habropoda laboriosa TaxID=597456 RepID=UPI00083DBD2F|nr:PREDICTED: diphosphomevalonate decarboxylase [Habropoda laboriosa]